MSKFELLEFQQQTVDKVVEAIAGYDHEGNRFSSAKSVPEHLRGKPKPYLHRIKAVTGAGKTPMLAAIAGRLGDCIILWTTPRSAVIGQTTESLRGKYKHLLGGRANDIEQLGKVIESAHEWDKLLSAKSGVTILTTTVGAFNQDDEKTGLRLHQGDPSPWKQLREAVRPIYVFYDEGHNATGAQFSRIRELKPRALLLASASALEKNLYEWIPGENDQDKQEEVEVNRTTVVPTKAVVENGLLKKTVQIFDLQTSEEGLLEEAVQMWRGMSLETDGKAVACYVVERTEDGLTIWQRLVASGVCPKSIAVHLTGAKKAANEWFKRQPDSGWNLLEATHDDGQNPSSLRDKGFKHIIWNISLEEGWDEPWAYVGYFHGEQSSARKVVQRIGRLIRNPFKNDEGRPQLPESENLQTVSCFLRTENALLKEIVNDLKKEMEEAGLSIIVSDKQRTLAFRMEECRREMTVPELGLFPDTENIRSSLLAEVFSTGFAEEDCVVHGKRTVFRIDMANAADEMTEDELENGIPSTASEIVKGYLQMKDSRLVKDWINPKFWGLEELQRRVYVGSRAYNEYRARCDRFVEDIPLYLRIDLDGADHLVMGIKLTNPNGEGTPEQQKHYKTHSFRHSLHGAYNGLNDFEVALCNALDTIGEAMVGKDGFVWARNPARVGYGIPLPRSCGGSVRFYPDFIAWRGGNIFFLETKGSHLLEEAKKGKLLPLPAGLKLGFFTENKEGFMLLREAHGSVNTKKGDSLEALLREILNVK